MSKARSGRIGAVLACCLGVMGLTEAGGCRELEPRAAEDAGTNVGGGSSSSGGTSSGGGSSSSSGSTDAAASSSSSSGSSSGSGAPPLPFDGGPILPAGDHVVGPNDRPGTLTVPTGYTGEPMPLVLLLHGTGSSVANIESFLKFKPTANAQGFFLLRAGAKSNAAFRTAWNATDSCCMYASQPDDSTYLAGLIASTQGTVAVDAKRIYVVGHSGGGFMAYRMACDHADLVAGIVSIAGANYDDASLCRPSEPVNVLQVHGESDGIVFYGGGDFYWYALPYPYPGAKQSIADWAGYNGCGATPAAAGTHTVLATNDTEVSRHLECRAGGAAELWSIEGATHEPRYPATFSAQLSEWLLARPKP